MKTFLEFVVQRLVNDPESVSIDVTEQGGSTVYGLHVAPSDMGKIIGRKGATINALRSVVQAGGAKSGRRCSVELIEN
jgi:predicted RNA-binding protein YlqC (UPF0109 family)